MNFTEEKKLEETEMQMKQDELLVEDRTDKQNLQPIKTMQSNRKKDII